MHEVGPSATQSTLTREPCYHYQVLRTQGLRKQGRSIPALPAEVRPEVYAKQQHEETGKRPAEKKSELIIPIT